MFIFSFWDSDPFVMSFEFGPRTLSFSFYLFIESLSISYFISCLFRMQTTSPPAWFFPIHAIATPFLLLLDGWQTESPHMLERTKGDTLPAILSAEICRLVNVPSQNTFCFQWKWTITWKPWCLPSSCQCYTYGEESNSAKTYGGARTRVLWPLPCWVWNSKD